MSDTFCDTAMVLAAGLGMRMRPLTLTTPKPLLAVAGKPIIEHVFDRLRAANVRRVLVNAHYLPEQIEAWAKRNNDPYTEISDERDTILDTGGGIVRALPRLPGAPFFVANGDGFWSETGVPAFERLREAWNDKVMDCLLLLSPLEKTTGFDGKGDFALHADGRLSRFHLAPGGTRPLAYIGGYIVHPRLFQKAPEGAFSMNLLWDRAIANGRLFGLEHDGHWFHVGTPDAIAAAEARLTKME